MMLFYGFYWNLHKIHILANTLKKVREICMPFYGFYAFYTIFTHFSATHFVEKKG